MMICSTSVNLRHKRHCGQCGTGGCWGREIGDVWAQEAHSTHAAARDARTHAQARARACLVVRKGHWVANAKKLLGPASGQGDGDGVHDA